METQITRGAQEPPKVRLRAVTASDLEIFYEQQRDEEAAAMAAFPPREHEAFMAHWDKIMRDAGVVTRTILWDGRVAGNIVSFLRGETREIGYWLGRESWGKGIATEALRSFLHVERSRPLHAGVAKHNAASIRVLEKCGFTRSHAEGEFFILKLA